MYFHDASFELDEALSTSVNLDAFDPWLSAKAAGVNRFVYASSSVYGVSDEPDVTEDHPLVQCHYIINIKDCANQYCSSIQMKTLLG